MSNANCELYSAPPNFCSALVLLSPKWNFSTTDASVTLLHNSSAIPLAQRRSAVIDSSLVVQFTPIILSVIPSVVQLRPVTSEILVGGLGFAGCAQDMYGWSLWLIAHSQVSTPDMMESRCRLLNSETLICIMPDWGAAFPAASIKVNILDCLGQDVMQILPQEFSIELLPSVLSFFPVTSSFKDAIPVTIMGRGFSSDLGLKVVFAGQYEMQSAAVAIVNHTIIVAATPNWGSLIPQQYANIHVYTHKDVLLGGFSQQPVFFLTHSIRRVFPLVYSAAGGSTATVYGLGFAPGSGYTCIFVASNNAAHAMSHSLGTAPGYSVIKCKLPSWGSEYRAGRVILSVVVPAQSLPIPVDVGVIELNFQPSVHSIFPVVLRMSCNIVAVVTGSGFGANMSVTMRLKSDSASLVAERACTIMSVVNMTCPVPSWSMMYPAQTVQVFFDIEAPDVSMINVHPDIRMQFLESVQSLHPTSGPISGGTMILFACEGLFIDRRIVVKFAEISGIEMSSNLVFATNASSLVVASPNWIFSHPSSTSFTADVTVRLIRLQFIMIGMLGLAYFFVFTFFCSHFFVYSFIF